VFQPHTFSRTRAFIEELSEAFHDADHVVVTDVYAAREHGDVSGEARQVASRIRHPRVQHAGDLLRAAEWLIERVQPGSVVITLSAGDGNQVGKYVLEGIASQPEGGSHE
jgi:UDP-N-acetylmuramate--alanine ligase